MDKKERKEKLRRYKKSRQHAQSSSSSSSSDSDSSYSSSSSEDERRKREKREHCQKKLEAKRNHLKRKLKEAKLKKRAAAAAAALSGHSHRALSPTTQAKLKKLAERKHQRAASKERREREREKHRAAARDRERDHHRVSSRSPTKITKIRIHQDVKRQKSPPRMHHQLMSREKIIIQTRTRDRTPSTERERQRHEHNKRHHDELARERERRDRERERAEREAARDKERAEALARCQERQRERERLAREKLRREEEEKKYGNVVDRGERLLPRPAERELALAASRGYGSRERSLEELERSRHVSNKRELDVYEREREREREYMEAERRGLLDREELRREREYMAVRRRELSPVPADHYVSSRIRDPRDLYPENERERTYSRTYLEDGRHPRDRDSWLDPRDMRERGEMHDIRDSRDFREIDRELMYADERERERLLRERERALATRDDWKTEWDAPPREREWHEAAAAPPPQQPSRSGFVGGPKRIGGSGAPPSETITKLASREQRANSEPDWDAEEMKEPVVSNVIKQEAPLLRDAPSYNTGPSREMGLLPDRRWTTNEWHDDEEAQRAANNGSNPMLLHRSDRGGRGSGFRRGPDSERNPTSGNNFRPHPPPLMTLPVQPPGGFHGAQPRFPNKRNMTYTNPNLLKKQQAAIAAAKAAAQASAVVAATTAVAAAKAAAQSVANATTNPGILSHVSGSNFTTVAEKLETGEIMGESNPLNVDVIEKVETNTIGIDDKMGSDLSEISDSDDEILTKTDKKSPDESDDGTMENTTLEDAGVAVVAEATLLSGSNEASNTENCNVDERPEDDEMLDFEEISDGELEEDARVKAGVGDALGVDWASLIAETKTQTENTAPNDCEQTTSAKERWQPHRLILDLGISMRMAGEEYAKRLLSEAKTKLDNELNETIKIKSEIKEEITSKAQDTDSDEIDDKNIQLTERTCKDQKLLEVLTDDNNFNTERLHPLACIQVTERQSQLQRQTLISSACGSNSRALSARQDLKLRRQLCGLPAKECDIPLALNPTSQKLKALAIAAFQRTLEVK